MNTKRQNGVSCKTNKTQIRLCGIHMTIYFLFFIFIFFFSILVPNADKMFFFSRFLKNLRILIITDHNIFLIFRIKSALGYSRIYYTPKKKKGKFLPTFFIRNLKKKKKKNIVFVYKMGFTIFSGHPFLIQEMGIPIFFFCFCFCFCFLFLFLFCFLFCFVFFLFLFLFLFCFCSFFFCFVFVFVWFCFVWFGFLTIFRIPIFKGLQHTWVLFLKTLYIFSKNKATLDNLSYGFGQKCSKELKKHSFTSAETIVVKL